MTSTSQLALNLLTRERKTDNSNNTSKRREEKRQSSFNPFQILSEKNDPSFVRTQTIHMCIRNVDVAKESGKESNKISNRSRHMEP